MSTSKITVTKKDHSKKSTRKEIGLQLANVLNGLKESLGEKKFERRIKKAAKLLTAGIKTKTSKEGEERKRENKDQ